MSLSARVVQFMLKQGSVSETQLEEFILKVYINDPPELGSLLARINLDISKQKFRIMPRRCEITGRQMYVFANTVIDDISKSQPQYSPQELEYFHLVCKEIITAQEKRVSYIGCANLPPMLASGKLSRTDAENRLTEWVRLGYLHTQENHYYLGPRYLAEYCGYLENDCADYVMTCHLCSETVFYGSVCTSCEKAFHNYCLLKLSDDMTKCPKCKKSTLKTNAESLDEDGDDTENDESLYSP